MIMPNLWYHDHLPRSLSLALSHSLPSSLDGSDFVLGVGDLFFPPGDVINSITILILDDELPESTESFAVSLSPGLDVEITTTLATVVINDNDG
jgi:hypothetical protein